MESQRLERYFEPIKNHDEAVSVQGLEELFYWASEQLADGLDGKALKAREQEVKRQVLSIIHKSAQSQAQAKHLDELAYLQRRVIALQAVLSERTEELSNLKQFVVAQYYSLQRIPELEEKLVQLESECKRLQSAEADQKELVSALAKMKRERDLLDDMLDANERENERLVSLLKEAKSDLEVQKAKRWWHLFLPPKK